MHPPSRHPSTVQFDQLTQTQSPYTHTDNLGLILTFLAFPEFPFSRKIEAV